MLALSLPKQGHKNTTACAKKVAHGLVKPVVNGKVLIKFVSVVATSRPLYTQRRHRDHDPWPPHHQRWILWRLQILECVATPSAVLKMRRKFFLQLAWRTWYISLSVTHFSRLKSRRGSQAKLSKSTKPSHFRSLQKNLDQSGSDLFHQRPIRI